MLQVPPNFRYVVEQTLREFFRAIQGGKDTEQSWKKSIYKVISRLDDPVPEYFKSPNFLEQLEWTPHQRRKRFRPTKFFGNLKWRLENYGLAQQNFYDTRI